MFKPPLHGEGRWMTLARGRVGLFVVGFEGSVKWYLTFLNIYYY